MSHVGTINQQIPTSIHSPTHSLLSKKLSHSTRDTGHPIEEHRAKKSYAMESDHVTGHNGLPNGILKNSSDQKPVNDAYVGFSNLPNQVHRRAVRRGFVFNLMVVGESGLGKSTFINSLFLADVYDPELQVHDRSPKTTNIETHRVVLKEHGVVLRLDLVDTPGFGDSVDNSNCWEPILEHINTCFDKYIAAESRVHRSQHSIQDDRIHALIYFIAPTGHTLKPLDVEFLTRIQDKVNVIPVIAKADTLTLDECQTFKKVIVKELDQRNIRVFPFPDPLECSDGGNDEELEKIRRLRSRIPFAVVGANTMISKDNGTRVRARVYPWGVVEVDNMEHNDFPALRYLLLTAFLQQLKDVTHNTHYDNYRYAKLSGIAMQSHFQTQDGRDPMALMEAEKNDHELKMNKMEAEMEAVFEQKVKEKTQKLREFEADLLRRADQMHQQLNAQEREQDSAREAFDSERASWEQAWREWDVGTDVSHNGATLGLGDRVINEVIKDRGKTEKKRKGLF